jgi:diguanylate cyclase (GGDEF)-like protein
VASLGRVSATTRTAEEWVSLVRVLLLLGLIPASWLGLLTASRPVADAIIFVLGTYVLLLTLGPRRLPILQRVDLIVVLDLGVVTLIVLVSGSAGSPFLYLYYLIVLEAACRLNLRQAMAASMAMASVVVMLWVREGHPEALETVGFRLGAFVASGFFLALLFGVLAQEYRASHDRGKELVFENELVTRLSGELRVAGVAALLLHAFLDLTRLPRGAAYVAAEAGGLSYATSLGFTQDRRGPGPADLVMPPIPAGALGGDVIIAPYPPEKDHASGVMVCVPLLSHQRPQMWLCGVSPSAPTLSATVRRHLRSLATHGVSALEAARLHERLADLAATDSLTGVANRRSFFDRMAVELSRSLGTGQALSVALLDLNRFKSINDGHGHNVGDEALVRVAETLAKGTRDSDLVARLGGDEFALLLPNTRAEDADKALARLAAAEISSSDGRGGALRLTLSWGTATWPQDGASPEQLLHAADRRLYLMKTRAQGET